MDSLSTQLNEQKRKVDFDSYDISVQQLIAMVETGQIDIAPAYQRQYRWKEDRQSRFIESIFLGIPIPSMFMATNADNTWEVVDGVQRLSTIIHYAGTETARKVLGLKDQLHISGLEKLTQLKGPFQSVPSTIQTQFTLRPIKVTTLSDKSDVVVRFDLFERLNTGGIALTNQEIRACIFRGPFNDLLEDLSKDLNFRKVVVLPGTREQDGTREEYILRFFAFFYEYKFFEHSVVGFLNDFTRKSVKKFDFGKSASIFRNTFSDLAKAFPNGINRRTKLTPVNLYEGIAVGAALAIKNKGSINTHNLSWIHSNNLKSLTTAATNNRKQLVGRIEYCQAEFEKP